MSPDSRSNPYSLPLKPTKADTYRPGHAVDEDILQVVHEEWPAAYKNKPWNGRAAP
jgi:hypothetical protein